jgi:hypothetical protein
MVGDSLNARRRRRQTRLEAEIKAHEKQLEQDISWEALQARNASASLKDEFWTVVLAIPLIMCFFPPLVPHIEAGFQALDKMPLWYRASLGVAIGAAFGVKSIIGLMSLRK